MLNLIATIALILPGFVFCMASPAQAQTVLFEDTFENGDNWFPLRNGSAYWTFDGQSANSYVNRSYVITELLPSDELWPDSVTDFELEYDFFSLQGVDKNIGFNVIDTKNYYDIHFTRSGYELARVKNGQVVFSQRGSQSIGSSQGQRVKLVFDRGKIQFWIDGQTTGEITDPTWDGSYGKFSLKASTGSIYPTRVRYDNLVVRELAEKENRLGVPTFKQTDPNWKDDEYDSAGQWSKKPGIGRWGCALSSLAMIMKYHGLSELPSGAALTPASLNNWLKSQADGYIGQGMLNWVAATRLTRLISDKLGTPKLEYGRIIGSSFDPTLEQLTKKQPVILQIDGHFLVGEGSTADENDLLIQDPAFLFKKFSQHATQLISTRTLTPSHTDLSFMVVAASPELIVTLQDASGNQVPNFFCATQTIHDYLDNSGEATSAQQICSLAKPQSTKYQLQISRPHLGEYQLEIYAYDNQANPSSGKFNGVVGLQPQFFNINYQKNDQSTITQDTSWAQFQNDLDLTYQQKQLASTYAYQQISRVVGIAQSVSYEQQSRYLNLLEQNLDRFSRYMTESGRSYLFQQFEILQKSTDIQ